MQMFYDSIEPEIREIVRALRDCGVNTTSSCGHRMTVEGDIHDVATDTNRISTVMLDMNLKFELVVIRSITDIGNYHSFYLYVNPKIESLYGMGNNSKRGS